LTLWLLLILCSNEDPTSPMARKDPLKLGLIDVKRAHFSVKAERDVWINLPPEDPRSQEEGICGKLLKSMCEILDAAAAREARYSKVLVTGGFRKGIASPCHFYRPIKKIWGLVRGCDFFIVARKAGREHIEEILRAHFELTS
jgi:hypothetical protein